MTLSSWYARNGGEVSLEQAEEWLHTLPGYKALIKGRVSDARKRQAELDRKVYQGRKMSRFPPQDVDALGREVEGCG